MISSFNHEYLQSADYRSTKGASKQRRENINLEIDKLRNLLPLPESSRKRLSQLQIMVLSKTYIEMANSFTNSLNQRVFDEMFQSEMIQALPGFLILLSTNGTILYISDNSTDYIGHSLVDVVSQCESIYEHMHEGDVLRFKSLLSSTNQAASNRQSTNQAVPSANQTSYMSAVKEGKLSVTFRFGFMKHIRRNRNFDRYKVLRMSGCFVTTQNGTRIFAGLCTPQFETMQAQSVLDTEVFVTTHSLDMNIINVDHNGKHYLGLSNYELTGKSLYELIYPQDVQLFAAKHKELLRTQNIASVNVRMLSSNGSVLNVHIVLRHVIDSSAGSIIICYYQIVDPVIGEEDKDVAVEGGYLVEPKKEVEVDCKLNRADILRRLKNKMDSRNNKATKRKATTFDPPEYNVAIAPKMQNIQPTTDQTFVLEMMQNSPCMMQDSPASVTSDYQAVTSLSEPEDIFYEDLSFHHTATDNKIPVLELSEIENFFQILDRKTEILQSQNIEFDAFSNWDWSNLNNSFFNQANLFDNLVPAIF